MKFILQIQGSKVILELEVLTTIMNALQNCERVDQQYQSATATTPAHYIDKLGVFKMQDHAPVACLTDDAYNAMKFLTEATKP